MKRNYMLLLLLFSLFGLSLSLSACSSKNSAHIEIRDDSEVYGEETDNDRTVILSELGLKYTTPDLWREYESTNIYPQTISSDGTFAQIIYSFVTEEGLALLNDPNAEQDAINSQLLPICQIVVLEKDNLDTIGIQSLMESYEVKEEVGTQKDYIYYLLSGYQASAMELDEENTKIYEQLLSAVPELKSSISTFDFNPQTLEETKEKLENTLTFYTTTLDGKEVNSTVFANTQLTMLNFGATYAHDESAELQKLQTMISKNPNVSIQLLTAYIDTPETETTETGKKLRSDANATYPTLMMDTNLGSWASKHLNGVPTTVFVDQNGQIIGSSLEGAKTAEEYWTEITQLIETTSQS